MFIVYSSKNLEQLTDTEIYSFQFSLSYRWQHLEWSILLVLCTVAIHLCCNLQHVRKGGGVLIPSKIIKEGHRRPASGNTSSGAYLWFFVQLLYTCVATCQKGEMWISRKLIKEGHCRPASGNISSGAYLWFFVQLLYTFVATCQKV